jgi:hypothetical protein
MGLIIMDVRQTDRSGAMAETRNEDWYVRYLRGEIGDKEARRLERAELRRWIRWIETDPAGVVADVCRAVGGVSLVAGAVSGGAAETGAVAQAVRAADAADVGGAAA